MCNQVAHTRRCTALDMGREGFEVGKTAGKTDCSTAVGRDSSLKVGQHRPVHAQEYIIFCPHLRRNTPPPAQKTSRGGWGLMDAGVCQPAIDMFND